MRSRPAEFLLVRSGVRALCGIPGSHAACVHARLKRCSGEISPSGPAPVSGTTPGMRAPYSGCSVVALMSSARYTAISLIRSDAAKG